jgi:hypothetical protein
LFPRSLGPTPERNSKLPTLRACGYKPTGSGALLEFILFSVIACNF